MSYSEAILLPLREPPSSIIKQINNSPSEKARLRILIKYYFDEFYAAKEKKKPRAPQKYMKLIYTTCLQLSTQESGFGEFKKKITPCSS